jgi:transglutaminase-like putative cysteine protease
MRLFLAAALTVGFRAELGSREAGALQSSDRPIPAPIREEYLRSTAQVPADEYADLAGKITAGKTGILDKAKAVYDWTVENTFRDPSVRGCGLGRPGRTLGQCKGGGKCADISTVFVTLARAAGVPARDVYGLRLSDPAQGEITSGFHCWAEFYLPGTGWVPVDPADVRKMMLVHDLELGDEATGEWRNFFWGGDDLFRLTLGKGNRGVVFSPRQEGPALDYFMYPYAEVDGKKLDYLNPEGFAYTVRYIPDRP